METGCYPGQSLLLGRGQMFYYYVILILLVGVCIVCDRRGRHSWLAILSVGSGVASPILEASTLEEALDGKESIKWPVPYGLDKRGDLK